MSEGGPRSNSGLPKLSNIYYTDKLIKAIASKDKSDPFYEHFLQSAQSLVYIKNTDMPSDDDIIGKKVYLPPLRKEGMKTIIFDLDETLIHCVDDESVSSDIRVPIKFQGGEAMMAGLNIRPYAKQTLKTLSKHFEIVVFTASHSCYANEVLNILDPDNKFISYRLYRDNCMKTKDGIFIKDLRVFGNRKLTDILLVDNAFYSYGF
jgi:CTD small phosphatase-like protein 2